MIKRWVAGAVAAGVITVALSGVSPAVRAKINSSWANWLGWSEEARRADPAGFAQFASGKLKQDLEVMERTRRELAAEIGHLAGKLRNQEAFRDQARQLGDEFRAKYQQAVATGGFPIQVRNAAYTQAQARFQVSMILAEITGHEAATGRLEKVKKQAEAQLEALTTRVNGCESQLAALAVQQEMLRAQQLTAEGEKLLAQVDELLDANSRALADNPVRTVRELLGSADDGKGRQASDAAVEAFLAVTPKAELQVVRVDKPVIEQAAAAQKANTGRAMKVEKAKPATFQTPAARPSQSVQQQSPVQQPTVQKKAKPIFQQY